MSLKMNRGIFVTENSINVAMLSIYIIYSSLYLLTDFSWGSSAEVHEPNFPSVLWKAHSAHYDVQGNGEFGHSPSWSNKLIIGAKQYNSNRKSKKKKKPKNLINERN